MQRVSLLRKLVAALACLHFASCTSTPAIVAVDNDPQPWMGADYFVLFHYLGWPDSIEPKDGRVGLSYSAFDWPREHSVPELVPVTFWISGRKVVEVSGDKATAIVLWGRSKQLPQTPYVVDVAEWNRRLGLESKAEEE